MVSDFRDLVLISGVSRIRIFRDPFPDCRKVGAAATSVGDYFVLMHRILPVITESEKVHFNRESPFLYDREAVRCCSAPLG